MDGSHETNHTRQWYPTLPQLHPQSSFVPQTARSPRRENMNSSHGSFGGSLRLHSDNNSRGGHGLEGAQTPGGGGSEGTESSSKSGSSSSKHTKTVKRRMRAITSCLECRRRKLRCDKEFPCGNCGPNFKCVYLPSKPDAADLKNINEIKEQVGKLERQLENTASRSSGVLGLGVPGLAAVADEVGGEATEGLEITPLVATDFSYEGIGFNADAEKSDSINDMIDLGFMVGRMRLTERIGGLARPRLAEEIATGLESSPSKSPDFATSSSANAGGAMPSSSSSSSTARAGEPAASNEDDIPSFLRPSKQFISPSAGLFTGLLSNLPPLVETLPSIPICNYLVQRYLEAVHPIVCCLHAPSFEQLYASFVDEVFQGQEPQPPLQALVFAVFFSAAVSMEEDEVHQVIGISQPAFINTIKLGLEIALTKANVLRTTRIETMQAFVIYLLTLCRGEVSRTHSVMVGAAIRMAQCMGLHRDGDAYGLTPLEAHIRRLLWHQLCFLDIRTCEAQGPAPAIRREDYDTCFPLNCSEEDLAQSPDSIQPVAEWTQNILPIIRFEINEMMRIVWIDRRRLEMRRTSLHHVLSKIEHFRKRMLTKYGPYLGNNTAIQRYTRLVMNLLLFRLHVMVLHAYHANASNGLPNRMNEVLVSSGIAILSIGKELETNPDYTQWRWYTGAYHQYQVALLLATEVFYRPSCPEAGRIWDCLDFVFGDTDNSVKGTTTSRRRIEDILKEVQEKTVIYNKFRRLRAPVAVNKAVPRKQAVSPTQQKIDLPSPQPGLPTSATTSAGAAAAAAAAQRRVSRQNTQTRRQVASVEESLPSRQQQQQQQLPPPLETRLPIQSHAVDQLQQQRQHMTQTFTQQQQQQQQQHVQGQGQGQSTPVAALSPYPSVQSVQMHSTNPASPGAQVTTSSMETMAALSAALSTPMTTPLSAAPLANTSPSMASPTTRSSFGTNMVFAGIANGEAIWSLAPSLQVQNPEVFSGGGVFAGGQTVQNFPVESTVDRVPVSMSYNTGQVMGPKEWEQLNAMFPKDPQTGHVLFGTDDPHSTVHWVMQ